MAGSGDRCRSRLLPATSPYLYEMLVHGRTDFPQQYQTGVYARNWMMDMRWIVRNFLTDRTDPTLNSRPLYRVMLEPLNFPREHSDTLSLDDSAPAWTEIRQTLGQLVGPLVRRIPPVQWRMAARAATAAQVARHMLFVCKGNTCRSPFAAEFLRNLALAAWKWNPPAITKRKDAPRPPRRSRQLVNSV